MRGILLASVCVASLVAEPVLAQHRGGGGGGFGSSFVGGALGGVVGSVLGNSLSQPPPPPVYAAPAPVYVAPPVVYERRVYVAPPPVYAGPAQRVSMHPWIGPGFVCYDPEPSAVTRAVCSSQDLSAQSLSLVQAYHAAMQQAPYNAASLRAEYAAFMQSERTACAPYSLQEQSDCISNMTAHARDVIMGRISGLYAEEAARPVELHVALQDRLRSLGLLPGTVDGVYGDSTRRAIAAWQRGQGRAATGVVSNDEVAMLMPNYQAPVTATYVPPPTVPAPSAPTPPAATPVALATPVAAVPAAPASLPDLLGGLRENVPYALVRPKLMAVGWQTQLSRTDSLSDQDRDARQWFIDHRIGEVQDCSSSGCKIELHNADGRLLYIYTQPGSRASDAYRGAGPAVIAYCLDVDDITCPAPTAPAVAGAQQALR